MVQRYKKNAIDIGDLTFLLYLCLLNNNTNLKLIKKHDF